MSTNSSYHVSGYHITTDPSFQHKGLAMPSELAEQFEELYYESQNKKNKKIIPRLTNLILKYPQLPQLKNYLTVAYNAHGNYKKAIEINNRTIAEHPDYLFGKLNLAYQYIADEKAYKIPELLGEAMELKALYPERNLFHLAEVTSFYKAAIYYFTVIKNLELAEKKLAVLKEIAPHHPDTKSSESFLYPLRLEINLERWKEDEAARIEVTCLKPIPTSKQETPPAFNHAEINNLYQYGLRIPAEKLKEVLALPRETVMEDLEQILTDAIDRYQYFNDQGWDEETNSFPLHAIFLLAELRSERSLPAILDFLENHDEVLEFWLGDHLYSNLWLPVYLLSQNNLELLKQFSIKPGIEYQSKTVATDALAQVLMHQPERRNEVAGVFSAILSYFNQSDLKDNIIDSDFLGLAIGNIIDCGLVELLPAIKELYEKKYVSLQINGPYEDVVEFLNTPARSDYKKGIKNIFELYQTILTTWAGYLEDDENEDDENENEQNENDDLFAGNYFKKNHFLDDEVNVPVVSVKIGRNEPCPCGSGKKYKKCCIDKLPIL